MMQPFQALLRDTARLLKRDPLLGSYYFYEPSSINQKLPETYLDIGVSSGSRGKQVDVSASMEMEGSWTLNRQRGADTNEWDGSLRKMIVPNATCKLLPLIAPTEQRKLLKPR